MYYVKARTWGGLFYIQWISIDEFHHYSMSVVVHGLWNGKASIIQCLRGVR